MTSLSPICLQCGSELLLSSPDEVDCPACGAVYPKTLGIIDLRKDRTPESDFDQRIISKMVEVYPTSTFNELIEVWMAEHKFSESIIESSRWYYRSQHERGTEMVEMFVERAKAYFHAPHTVTALDFGCGVGASFDYLSKHFEQVVGIDLSLVSLILAKKYIEEKGYQNVFLIRAQGDHLPFHDQGFDFIVALNVLEHIFIVETMAREIHRVLKNGGIFAGDSRNRYDLFLPEPHTHLRLLGYLPRRLAKKVAQWRTNNDYDDVYLLSYAQLKRAFQRSFGKRTRVLFPRVQAYGYSGKVDQVISKLEHIPVLGTAALSVFPSHLVIAEHDSKADTSSSHNVL